MIVIGVLFIIGTLATSLTNYWAAILAKAKGLNFVKVLIYTFLYYGCLLVLAKVFGGSDFKMSGLLFVVLIFVLAVVLEVREGKNIIIFAGMCSFFQIVNLYLLTIIQDILK